MSSVAETSAGFAARGGSVPSKVWYWVAVAVAVIGVAGAITWGVTSTLEAHDQAQRLTRTSTPGSLLVEADAGDKKLVFFEGEGTPSLDALRLTVTAPNGLLVAIRPYDLLMEYEIAGWLGRPVATFVAPVTGAYRVTADGPSPAGHVSVGDNFVRTQAIAVVGALILLGASIVAGAVIAIVVAAQRARPALS